MDDPAFIERKSGAAHINVLSFFSVAFAALAWWIWCGADGDSYGVMAAIIAGFIAATTGIATTHKIYSDWRWREKQRKSLLATTALHTARWASDADMEEAGMFDPNSGRPLGLSMESGVAIFEPSKLKPVHSKIIATPGSGKTIAGAVTAILHLAQLPGGPSAFIMDVKKELTAMCAPALRSLGIDVSVIDDTCPGSTERDDYNPYGPLVDALHSDDAIAQKQGPAFARALSRAEFTEPKGGEDKNRYWRDGARKILTFGKLYLAQRMPAFCTPPSLWELLADPGEIMVALKYEAAQEEGSCAAGILARDLLDTAENNPEHFSDFRSSAAQKIECYERGGLLENVGTIANRRHAELRERRVFVFMQAPLEYVDVFETHYKLQLQAFLLALKRNTGSRRVEFILDEVTNAAPLSGLVGDLTTIRGLGGRVHLIGQAESEFIRRFGKDAAETINAVTDVKQFLGINSYSEAEALSKALSMGATRSWDYNFSSGNGDVGARADRSGRALATADEILTMDREEQIILINGLRPVKAKKLPYNQISPICEWVAPNPLEGDPLPPDPKVFLKYPKQGEAA